MPINGRLSTDQPITENIDPEQLGDFDPQGSDDPLSCEVDQTQWDSFGNNPDAQGTGSITSDPTANPQKLKRKTLKPCSQNAPIASFLSDCFDKIQGFIQATVSDLSYSGLSP